MTAPDVTVVIVVYHQRRDLERLLPTLAQASRDPLEVLVLDNGARTASGEDTRAWLAEAHPAVRLLALDANVGYGAANNLGVLEARGEFVLLLNPDTEVHPGAIDRLRGALPPQSFVNPCLLLPDGRVNALGLAVSPGGIATCDGLYGPAPTGTSLRAVAALSGAAIFGRREDWLKVGGFVPEYFLYGEDVEWSMRALARGFSLFCVPDALVVHHYRASLPPHKWFYLARNRRLTFYLALEESTRRRMRAAWTLTNVALLLYAAGRGPRYVWADVAAMVWVWHRRRWVADLARRLAARRIVPDREVLQRWGHGASPRATERSGGGWGGRLYDHLVRRLAARAS
ncbi:MAG: glycosyltransferase [Thermaerobacter sp.]|nr:glycosyltransferase [Thermaerobacter sp.]